MTLIDDLYEAIQSIPDGKHTITIDGVIIHGEVYTKPNGKKAIATDPETVARVRHGSRP